MLYEKRASTEKHSWLSIKNTGFKTLHVTFSFDNLVTRSEAQSVTVEALASEAETLAFVGWWL